MTYQYRRRKRSRRGVLLLVVLSLLVMFLLAGMTFIVVASSFKNDTAIMSRHEQAGDSVDKVVDGAIGQIIRGVSSNNSQSVLAGSNSLLDDMYGRDGFVGQVVGFDFAAELETELQFVQLYFKITRHLGAPDLGSYGDYLRDHDPNSPTYGALLNITGAVAGNQDLGSLFNPRGIVPVLSGDDSRFNGCVITFTSGINAGKSTRIVNMSRKVGPNADDQGILDYNNVLIKSPSLANSGSLLLLQTEEGIHIDNFTKEDSFVINGRPFNGRGTGFASVSDNVDAQLEIVGIFDKTPFNKSFPVSLLPNETGIRRTLLGLQAAWQDGDAKPVGDVTGDGKTNAFDLTPFVSSALANPDAEYNVLTALGQPPSSAAQSDEAWDAADHQNMHLAWLPTMDTTSGLPNENHPILPSFHRPDLVNYWFNELLKPGNLLSGFSNKADAVFAFEYPYGLDRIPNSGDEDPKNLGVLNQAQRRLLVDIRRMFIMRPLPEDHPEFNGSNRGFHSMLSGWADGRPVLSDWGLVDGSGNVSPAVRDLVNAEYNPSIPFSTPLDVDNDGDGVADSVWLDFGFPTTRTADGRVYKPLIAPLCIDMDSRVNLNSADRLENTTLKTAFGVINPAVDLDGLATSYGQLQNNFNAVIPGAIAQPFDLSFTSAVIGGGYGPAEIGLFTGANFMSPAGVVQQTGTALSGAFSEVAFNYNPGVVAATWMAARYGSSHSINGNVVFEAGANAIPGGGAFSDAPYFAWRDRYTFGKLQALAHVKPNTFVMRPADLHGRTVLALNHNGHPVYANSPTVANEFLQLPYETNLLTENRFDTRFTEHDLEGILRSWDSNAPNSRVVSTLTVPTTMITPTQRQGQLDFLARNLRSVVTTRSFETPSMPTLRPSDYNFRVIPEYVDLTDPDNWLIRRKVLIDNNSDPVRRILRYYNPATNAKDGAELRGLNSIADLFAARLLSEHSDHGVGGDWGVAPPNYMPTNVQEFELDMALMLPYEIARGQRFDINRPFGDGRDNDGNGFVDESGSVTLSLASGNVEITGEIGDPSQFLFNLLNGDLALLNMANSPTIDDRRRVLPEAFPLRQTYARHLYCLMMFLLSPEYEPDYNGDDSVSADERKQMARSIAQYVINVVDARDADDTMTPFEFDLNPYNGWDVTYDMIDVAGDEEEIVWGMEQPNLLLTETLAFHDRRTENLERDEKTDHPSDPDEDFDQRLLPHSAFYAELYNCGPTTLRLDQSAPGGAPVWRLMVSISQPVGTDDLDPDDPHAVTPFSDADIDRFVYFGPTPLGGFHKNKPFFYRRPAVQLADLLPGRYAVVGSGREDGGGGEFKTYVGRPIPEGVPIDTPAATQELSGIEYDETRQITLTPVNDVAVNQISFANNVNDYSINERQPTIAVVVDQWDDPATAASAETRVLSISDPREGYELLSGNAPFGPDLANGERTFNPPLDEPFHVKRSTAAADPQGKWKALRDTGTTNGFRTVYLQRLADPNRPWELNNNPYRTVDRISTDLTVFNGLNPHSQTENEPNGLAGPATPHTVNFRTLQRGEAEASGIPTLPRSLWRTEPRREPLGANTKRETVAKHYFPFELQHTLGYLNRSYGGLDSAGAHTVLQAGMPDVPPAYYGAPNAESGLSTVTFPWIIWNNRPFTSTAELLNIPRSRSSRIMDDFSYLGMWASTGGQASVSEFNEIQDAGAKKIHGRSASFGHLLDFFGTETEDPAGPNQQRTMKHSPHWYRLIDFVEVRSPFAGVEQNLNEGKFSVDAGLTTTGYRMPLNYVSRFRNPGKVNANTASDPRVWTSINASFPGARNWDDLQLSRRGSPRILAPGLETLSLHLPNNDYPTLFTNPIRPASNATLMPNATFGSTGMAPDDMLLEPANMSKRVRPVDGTLLRAESNPATGNPNDNPFFLFQSVLPYNDTRRNSAFRYQGYQRMQNLTTTQSNVYAIWLTVGYFEVNPETGQLGQELGMDTGDVKRHRAFYIIDRSIPVAFEPGQNHNVDKCVVLRRMIE